MVTEELKLRDRAILIMFIRSKVGLENELFEYLSSENPGSILFKILGRFDILMVSRINSLNDCLRLYSDERILEINSYPCINWDLDINSFWNLLSSSLSPTLTFIKLQEPVFIRRGIKGIEQTCGHICGQHEDLFYFIGFGFYEICVFKLTESYEQTFAFIENTRKITISDIIPTISKNDQNKAVFTKTITVPLISVENIIKPENWDSLEGVINPLITLKCAPGHEGFVSSKWPKSWSNILGAEDLICIFPEAVPLSEFAKDLTKFRESAAQSLRFFNTTTNIYQSRIENNGDENFIPPEYEKPPYSLFEQLKALEKIDESNQVVISELINVVSLINICLGNRVIKFAYSDILFSVKYLNWLLSEYKNSLRKKKKAEIAEREDELLCYAESVRIAIYQHFPHEDYVAAVSAANKQSLDCSLSTVIKAISVLPEQLFSLISKTAQPHSLSLRNQKTDPLYTSYKNYNMPWKGFVLLSLSENYQVLDQSERINIPFRDIFSVLNWITLSHEVSHAYYIRIDWESLEADYLDNYNDHIKRDRPELLNEFEQNWSDSHYEFFAHWFDYRHFFNGELLFYLWSIWRTWIEIPRPYQFPEEYWLRALFIKICDNWSTIRHNYDTIYHSGLKEEEKIEEYTSLFRDRFVEVDDFVKQKFPDHYNDLALNDDQIDIVLQKMVIFKDLVRKFEDEYVNSDLIHALNKSSSKAEKDISIICEGGILRGKVENPFLLLKGILKKIYHENFVINDVVSSALIFSLWQASRHIRRPKR